MAVTLGAPIVFTDSDGTQYAGQIIRDESRTPDSTLARIRLSIPGRHFLGLGSFREELATEGTARGTWRYVS
jgi:hypothetical protein